MVYINNHVEYTKNHIECMTGQESVSGVQESVGSDRRTCACLDTSRRRFAPPSQAHALHSLTSVKAKEIA